MPAPLVAQGGEIVGRVLSDSAKVPLAGVTVSIVRLGKSSVSDNEGRFRLAGLPSGDHWVVLRALGFRLDSARVEVDEESVVRDFTLSRSAQSLPGREIVASAPPPTGKMAEFIERQNSHVGHFITRKDLTKAEGGQMNTGDVISKAPGTRAIRGQNKAWMATTRAPNPGGPVFSGQRSPDRASQSQGASPWACYMDVYVDGVLVYDDTMRGLQPLFDVNTIPPEHIEGIEVYSSAAQIPAKYNKTGSGCGAIIIWTRI